MRHLQFPSLDERFTKSMTKVTKHAFLPTDELKASMDDFVDALDLNQLAEEVDG